MPISDAEIEMLRPIVWSVACGYRKRTHEHFPMEDFIGECWLCALKVYPLFKPCLGVPLEAYMRQRLGWALKDYARSQDSLTRGQRRSLNKGDFSFELHSLGSSPEARQVMPSPERYVVGVVTLENLLKRVFLTERERQVLVRAYFQEASLYEVGVQLGISQGRVSHIKKQVLEKLRKAQGMEDKRGS